MVVLWIRIKGRFCPKRLSGAGYIQNIINELFYFLLPRLADADVTVKISKEGWYLI